MDTVNHIKLRVERTQAKALLRYVLYAIFFHRNLDNVEPDTDDFLDAHVAYASSRELEKEIAAKTDEFAQAFIEAGAHSGEIAVVFLQRKNRKGWFAVTEELVPWEEHLVTIDFASRTPPGALTGALFQLVSFCSENKGNVPPLVGSGEQNNLSHQILISPPPPSELFAPNSPPLGPVRLLSPPPAPVPSTTTQATATAKDVASPAPLSSAPGSHGYGYGYGYGHSRATSGTGAGAGSAGGGGGGGGMVGAGDARRASAPMVGAGSGTGTSSGPMGYLEQAKDGLLAVGAKAGAGVGWGGRAVGAAFSRSSGGTGGGAGGTGAG